MIPVIVGQERSTKNVMGKISNKKGDWVQIQSPLIRLIFLDEKCNAAENVKQR